MEELHKWLPLIVQVISTIIVIVWSFAKLDKRIAIIETKFDNMCGNINEIKDNHLSHLASDVNKIGEKLQSHLINHSSLK